MGESAFNGENNGMKVSKQSATSNNARGLLAEEKEIRYIHMTRTTQKKTNVRQKRFSYTKGIGKLATFVTGE